jgi:DNA-binding response OmpR family regulator
MENNRPRLLVIEPDFAIRTMLVALARHRGFDADIAMSRDEALRRSHAHRYAAVILDPRIADGEELMHELPSRNLIVATTATGYDARKSGIAAVLRKPFMLDELSAAIDVCSAVSVSDDV